MSKDIDSVRVALENAFRGLPVEEQAKLVAEWMSGAFDWAAQPEGAKFWRTARDRLLRLEV